MSDVNNKFKYRIDYVLNQILNRYRLIDVNKIELFSEVYYPIAILEGELNETAYEDFELAQMAVLKFVREGMTDAEEIAKIMGLGIHYVQDILKQLTDYNFISEKGITEDGLVSLKSGKKILHNTVKQRFQADAITGELLKVSDQLFEVDFENKDHTVMHIPHLLHREGLSQEDINEQLSKNDLSEYKRYKDEIFNANLDEIRNISCVDLQYIRAYMLKLQNVENPIIFSYRYDSSTEKFSERLSWLPMRVPYAEVYGLLGFSKKIGMYRYEDLKNINLAYELICDSFRKTSREEIEEKLATLQPFNFKTTDISLGKIPIGVPEQIHITVQSDSFRKWNVFLLKFLEKYNPDTGFVYADTIFNGLILRFNTRDDDVLEASGKYRELLAKVDGEMLNNYIRKNLFNENAVETVRFKDFTALLDRYHMDYFEETEW